MAPRYYTFRRDVPKLKPGQRVDFRRGKGYFVIPAPVKIKPPVVPPKRVPGSTTQPSIAPSMFSGDGVFCTTDTDSSHGWDAQWTAAQIDPEGDATIGAVPGKLCYWTARPTAAIYQRSNSEKVPLIVQSENEAEFLLAMKLYDETPIQVPHALIGKCLKEWANGKAQEIAAGNAFDLILEWYWVNEPSYVSPDADGYVLFRNVCYGTFNSETVPGRRVYVDEQDAVWHGPRSVWDTEAATGRDRLAFNAR